MQQGEMHITFGAVEVAKVTPSLDLVLFRMENDDPVSGFLVLFRRQLELHRVRTTRPITDMSDVCVHIQAKETISERHYLQLLLPNLVAQILLP